MHQTCSQTSPDMTRRPSALECEAATVTHSCGMNYQANAEISPTEWRPWDGQAPLQWPTDKSSTYLNFPFEYPDPIYILSLLTALATSRVGFIKYLTWFVMFIIRQMTWTVTFFS